MRGKVPDGAGLPLPGTPGAVTLLSICCYPPPSGRFSFALPRSTALVMLCFHLIPRWVWRHCRWLNGRSECIHSELSTR